MRVTARYPPCDNVRFKYHGPMIGRHGEVGLHLELVDHLRAVAVALEHPFRGAVLEVAALGQTVLLIQYGAFVSSRSVRSSDMQCQSAQPSMRV